MKELKELVKIVDRHKVKHLNVMTSAFKQGKMFDLYDAVYSGKISTDEEAIKYLYEETAGGPSAYRKLKERLKKQLINIALFIGTSVDMDKRQQLYYELQKNVTATKIIRSRGVYHSAIALARKTLKLAIRLEDSEVIVQMARLLMGMVGYMKGEKDFKKYSALLDERMELLYAEYKARKYTDHIILLTSLSSNEEKLLPILRQYEKDLRNISIPKPSANLLAFSYFIYVNRSRFENNHKELQVLCEEAIDRLGEKEFANPTFILVFLLQSFTTYYKFLEFDKGVRARDKALHLLQGGSRVNWFALQYHYVKLSFYCNQFEAAYDAIMSSITDKGFKKIGALNIEHWEIYYAYMIWLISVGRIDKPMPKKNLTSFRLAKFLNTLPQLSKDKEGYYTPIFILQLLFLVHQKKYDALIDRMESFKTHTYRYLNKRALYRSKCFINLLILLPACQFNKIALIRKSKTWRKRLSSKAINDDMASMQIEIIPYETLWEIVLEQLEIP